MEETMTPAALEVTIAGLTHSAEIGELAKAMAQARKKFKTVKKEAVNPFFKSKYADLPAIIDATESALADHDLVILQSPRFNGETVTVTTMLMHGSGQWMRDDLTLPMAKFDAQGAGSAITYARRYALQSFVNVAAEADDDGNAASGKDVKEVLLPRPPARKPESAKPNGETFQAKFWRVARGAGKTEATVREYIGSLGYEHTEEIPPSKHQEALAWAGGAQ